MNVPATNNIQSIIQLAMTHMPPTKKELASSVTELLAQFPQRRMNKDEADIRLRGYLVALEGRPYVYIRQAIRNFIRGEVNGVSPHFVPLPSQLGAEVRRIENEDFMRIFRVEMANRQAAKNARYSLPLPKISKAAKTRAQRLVNQLKQEIATAKLEPAVNSPSRTGAKGDRANARAMSLSNGQAVAKATNSRERNPS